MSKSSEVFPLAIFTSGFKVDASQYRSYAEHLASWGYVVLTYDKMEKLSSSLTDLNCAKVITELVSWAASNQLFSLPLSPEGVYLCGHSKGAKVSVLAAAQDPRVAALCLIDPVDNTVYAPLSPGYPSAVAALAAGEGSERGMEGENERGSLTLAVSLPTLVVGAAMAGDCAPLNANFRRFSRAASAPSWEVVLLEAAHLQFLDRAPILQSAICGTGIAKDANIGAAARAVMAAWGELTVKGKAKPCWSDSNRFFIENTEKYGNSHLEACQAVAAIQGITWKLGQTNAVVSRVKF